MDTLAVSGHEGMPYSFTTKFYPVPHLRGVICGTGDGKLIAEWFLIANTGMVVRDFFNLDHHTPRHLRNLARRLAKDFPVNFTTTVYHFGFGVDSGEICRFAYRSTNDFRSEVLPDGLALKPEGTVPAPFELPTHFEDIMRSQRKAQESKPIGERVFIGGDIWVCHLTRSGFSVYQKGGFDDRDTMFATMLKNVERDSER